MIFGWGKKKKKAADTPPAKPAAQATPPAPPSSPPASPPAPQVQPAAPAPTPAAQAPTASPRAPAPWGPENDAAANQAIGGLRNYLLSALKTDRGIHAETILVASGALAGYAAIHAVFEAYLKRGRAQIGDQQAASTGKAIVEVKTQDGQTFYFGDLINSFLAASHGPASRQFF